MASVSVVYGHIQKGSTAAKLRLLPVQWARVDESVGLRVEPDGIRARIMRMTILAGSVGTSVLDEVLKLRTDMESSSWNVVCGKLTSTGEQHICRQVTKSQWSP